MIQKKKICLDIDGVICKVRKDNNYKFTKPIKKNIKFINKIPRDKYKIILFTSRFMGRTNDSKKKAIQIGYKFTKKQLKKWQLEYDQLIMGKPSYDLIVDDKSLFFKTNWIEKLNNKIKNKKF